MTLPWTCEKCGTRHRHPDEAAACHRSERRLARIVFALVVAGVLGFFLLEAAWASYAYGDWKCAFIQCRKVVP